MVGSLRPRQEGGIDRIRRLQLESHLSQGATEKHLSAPSRNSRGLDPSTELLPKPFNTRTNRPDRPEKRGLNGTSALPASQSQEPPTGTWGKCHCDDCSLKGRLAMVVPKHTTMKPWISNSLQVTGAHALFSATKPESWATCAKRGALLAQDAVCMNWANAPSSHA